jgi:hypothetical protein
LEQKDYCGIIKGFLTYMSIDPVKIPQNVYVEDRIIGPVTLRQIFLTLGGGGVSYAMFALVKQAGKLTLFTGLLSWSPLIIMAAFAFIKINGISLFRFSLLMAEKSGKPTVRYWQPRVGISITPKNFIPKKAKIIDSFSHSQEEYDEIANLSSVLDTGISLKEKKAEQMEESGSGLPVQKDRVSVETPTEKSVDTVTAASEKQPVATSNIVQDVVPPK